MFNKKTIVVWALNSGNQTHSSKSAIYAPSNRWHFVESCAAQVGRMLKWDYHVSSRYTILNIIYILSILSVFTKLKSSAILG